MENNVSLGLLKRVIDWEPGCQGWDCIKLIIDAGEELIERGHDDVETRIAIAKASMFLDIGDANYETALGHLESALEMEPKNKFIFDYMNQCIKHLYSDTDDNRYIVKLLDITMKKADVLKEEGPVFFIPTATHDELKRGMEYDPVSRGVLFFTLTKYMLSLSKKDKRDDVDMSDFFSVARRAYDNFPTDGFMNGVIEEAFDHMAYGTKKICKRVLHDFPFKEEKKIIPMRVVG